MDSQLLAKRTNRAVYWLTGSNRGLELGRVFDELKRRNVFRVAVAYVIASWLILQVADIVLQGIEAPAWVMKVFMLVLALGLPFVLMFSWAYELTPDGIKKEKDVDRSRSITPETGRKLNLITIGMLVSVVVLVGIDRIYMHGANAPVPVASPPTAPTDRSIAVLAFEDLSPEGDQEYFADGLSEELLNVLAKVEDLKVAGRTSSFAFKGTNTDLREIGELLNVAHILEGSVRKAGNRIRVTAQLIKADDGFHLFSETYDRDLDDIFAVQDEIAQKISGALLTEIVGTEIEATAQTDTEAYELYLQARQRIHTRDIFNLREANTMLDRVLEIDQRFAPAHAQKALVMHLMSDALGAYGDIPMAESMPLSRQAVERALTLDDELPEAHAVNGLLLDNVDRVEEAIAALERARELNPTLSDAANWLSTAYATVDRRDDARKVLEEVVERDPTYGPAFNNLIASYTRTSQFDNAEALISRVERIVGDNDDVQMANGMIAVMKGDVGEGARRFKKVLALNPSSSVAKMWYGFALLGLADYETLAEAGLAEHRILAYSAQDYVERALEDLQRFDMSITFAPRAIDEIGAALVTRGEVDAYLEFVKDNYGSAASLLVAQPASQAWGTAYLPVLAWTYRQNGETEAARLFIDEASRIIAEFPPDVARNWVYSNAVARQAALTGDDELALAKLRQSVEDGLRILIELDLPLYNHLREDDRFKAIADDLLRAVNDERAKVDLPPYRPLSATEERPTFVN